MQAFVAIGAYVGGLGDTPPFLHTISLLIYVDVSLLFSIMVWTTGWQICFSGRCYEGWRIKAAKTEFGFNYASRDSSLDGTYSTVYFTNLSIRVAS